MLKNKGADLKIQETAFMLLALVLFFVLIFLFYSNVQMSKLYTERNRLLQERGISMLSKIASMPELSSGNELDYDKMLAIKNVTNYNGLFKGILKIEVMKIYPEKEILTIMDNVGNKDYISYSSYEPLCYTVYEQGEAYSKCELAKLIVYVEQVSQAK